MKRNHDRDKEQHEKDMRKKDDHPLGALLLRGRTHVGSPGDVPALTTAAAKLG